MNRAFSLENQMLKDLGGGLILRRATTEDADALSDFNAMIHSDDGPDKPDEKVGAWTRDLLERPHPTFSPQDFTIIEDTNTGKIVSSMNLISQIWSYAGISFKVGRPELVGTQPEYRNRGLVRQQFNMIHEWSAARGELVQAITGIPYYYRLFGYEMAMNLSGGRAGYLPNMPVLKGETEEPFVVRPATTEDLSFIQRVYSQGSQRGLVRCEWSIDLWRYEWEGKSEKNVNQFELRIITDRQGNRVGFLAHPFFNWGDGSLMAAIAYELIPGIAWSAVTPSVVRYLCATGSAYAARDVVKKPFGSFGFWLGEEHPVYEAMKERLPRVRKPYAWYLRVADLPGFIRYIAPVLEHRLASSIMVGYTGEIKITFYRNGLRLVIRAGPCEGGAELASGAGGALGRGCLSRAHLPADCVWLPFAGRVDLCLPRLLG